MGFNCKKITVELPDASYDGRNGFSTYNETTWNVYETGFLFGKPEERLLCKAVDEEQANRIVVALALMHKLAELPAPVLPTSYESVGN